MSAAWWGHALLFAAQIGAILWYSRVLIEDDAKREFRHEKEQARAKRKDFERRDKRQAA